MSANPTNPKPGFTPSQPATYTPHAKKPGASPPAPSEPAGQSDESSDRRPSAPERPDVPDRSNPPAPVSVGVEDADSEEKTRDMTVAETKAFGSGDRDARGRSVTGNDHPGEGRRPQP